MNLALRSCLPAVLGAAAALSITRAEQPPQESAPVIAGLAKIQRDATRLTPHLKSDLAVRFIAGVAALEPVTPRTLYRDEANKVWLCQREADRLSQEARAALKPKEFNEDFYYNTKYGSPLAYSRPLEVLAQARLTPTFATVSGRKILDFGYGGIGHLRLLGALGAHAVGVDVDSLLKALYNEPDDQGAVASTEGPAGSVTLVHGSFPGDPAVASQVGTGYDLIISKNTLKMGYIHPARPVDPARLVHLGVDDRRFVQALFDLLKPGGAVLIYNLSPAPSKPDEEYKPWTDGRCPFAREIIESIGFRVVAFDAVDDAAARAMGRALQWDVGGMDLEHDLFAHYTLLQRPADQTPGGG